MFELIRALITEPFYAFVAVIFIWVVLRIVLINISNLSKVTWTRLEYIWIGIGLLGILTLIDENRKQFQINELERTKIWIANDYESLLNYTTSTFHCLKFNNTGIFTQEEFDKRQDESDRVCDWIKKVNILVDSAILNGNQKIIKLPKLEIKNEEKEPAFLRVKNEIQAINEYIDRRDELIEKTQDNFWQGFKYGFGILLLIVAFGIRLTIISNKVKNEKKTRHNK
jgi:hypothetical protein